MEDCGLKHPVPSMLLMLLLIAPLGFVSSSGAAELTPRVQVQDPEINHLVDPAGYRTAPLGSPLSIIREGSGRQPVILIPGLGFSGEEFRGFLEQSEATFDLHLVTLPGFGETPAPPSPKEGVSWGKQTWTHDAIRRIEKVIETNGLRKPIVVGHWITGTQVALRLALRNPDNVSAVILLAGTARYEPPQIDESDGPGPTLEERVKAVDSFVAPRWFKSITRETWDDNNFLPGDYVRNPVLGLRLWRTAARPPLHVWIRYLCEFFAQDVTTDLKDLKVPTLLIQPGLEGAYQEDGMNYLDAYLYASWARSSAYQFLDVVRVPDSRIMIWHDRPAAVEAKILDFLTSSELIGDDRQGQR